MIQFRSLNDDHPALAHSPMVRAVIRTFDYIAEHGSIPLTPSKAFKRVFVHWAAREFEWPGYTEDDLFYLNKVLNEIDFPPLMELHDIMLALKIGRHYKGAFKLTRAGQGLVGHPANVFGIVTPFYLFETRHELASRFGDDPIPGNWDVFLNVLNVEAEGGATGADLRRVLYGEPDEHDRFDYMLSGLYLQVLRPLCWTGLLSRTDAVHHGQYDRAVFAKTPLWHAALKLDTDDMVTMAMRH